MGFLGTLARLLAVSALAAAQTTDYDDCNDTEPTSTTSLPSSPTSVASVEATSTTVLTPVPTTLTTISSSVPLPTSTQSPEAGGGGGSPPPGTNATLTSISFSGNGCPQSHDMGRYANYTGGDFSSSMEFTFHNFTAVQREGYSPTQRTTNCQAHLQGTGGPEGWQISPDIINYRGLAVLDPETTLSFFITTYWSQDAAYTFTTQQSVANTGMNRMVRIVNTNARHEVWSPCIGSNTGFGVLNINFRASITTRNASAMAYFGPLDVMGVEAQPVEQTVSYRWRQCRT